MALFLELLEELEILLVHVAVRLLIDWLSATASAAKNVACSFDVVFVGVMNWWWISSAHFRAAVDCA
eukprot:1122351-Ditylum_brightwellii.AAC.1